MPLPLIDGEWLLVDCDVSVFVPVWISVGDGDFVPAFRDFYQGRRVAKIRNPGLKGDTPVRLKIGETVAPAGTVKV